MLEISNIAKVEKNKLSTNSVFLVMLEINIPSVEETIRIVSNTEDIVWNSHTWQKFPFEPEEIQESANAERSEFTIKVSNVNNIIGQYVRQYDVYIKQNGYEAVECVLYVVNSKDLENTNPLTSHNLTLTKSSLDHFEVRFTVGARDTYNSRIPNTRMFPNNCRYRFKSIECGYAGAQIDCDNTLSRCRELNNSGRFGGFPAIGNKSVVV